MVFTPMKTFRLTRKSIDNVERCLGMRTCGEAVALFAEQKSVKPSGECSNGHQDAALRVHDVRHPAHRAMPKVRKGTQILSIQR